MQEETFDIEDLSQVIQIRAEESASMPNLLVDVDDDDITIPISIDLDALADSKPDNSLEVIDTLTKAEHYVYRSKEGRFLRYRIGVLGIGQAVEEIHAKLKSELIEASDQLVQSLGLWARYEVGLFGGQPRHGGVSKQHAELLADNLAGFRPNYLVLVNAGKVKQNFAEQSAQQLAMLTRCINQGALRGGQRPFSLVFVVNEAIPDKKFAMYMRSCQSLSTPPAMMQFLPEEVPQLIEYARFELRSYTRNHLEITLRE